MALKPALTPLVITLTQGSADAFVQSSVLTGLSGNQAWDVRRIQIEFPPAQVALLAGDTEVTVTLTRRSKAAIPLMSDSDVIAKFAFANPMLTSGSSYVPCVVDLPTPEGIEIPIVEETIYAQLDSSTTTLTWANVVVRLEARLDTMQPVDRLNLIARSLT